MTDVTTAKFPRPVLDRLKGYGMKGQTYAQIVSNLMDRVDRDSFVEEQFRIHAQAQEEWKGLRRIGAA